MLVAKGVVSADVTIIDEGKKPGPADIAMFAVFAAGGVTLLFLLVRPQRRPLRPQRRPVAFRLIGVGGGVPQPPNML